MEIRDEDVNWAVAERLGLMLESPPRTEYEVTHAYALFMALCFWVRRHGHEKYSKKPYSPSELYLSISERPWDLPSEQVQIASSCTTAWCFFVWVRDTVAHGAVSPIHKIPGQLTGFRFEREGSYVELNVGNMHHLGTNLAGIFCRDFSPNQRGENEDAMKALIVEENTWN
jgi:hypothetical protein